MAGASSDRVVVVGGGISGLTAAHRLLGTANGRGIDVTVVEAADRAGGKLLTGALEVGGDEFPVEEGADSFVVRKPWARELCRELGLEGELVGPAPGGAHVWARGRLVPFPSPAPFGVPASAEALARWPGLSRAGRLRAVGDLLRPVRRDGSDESILDLLTRRLGREAAAVLVGPLLAGIHAGDPAALGTAATFPELRGWERDFGSLVRGARAAVRAARPPGGEPPEPIFATVWTGLSRLVSVLAAAIGEGRIRTGEPVAGIERRGTGWEVRLGGEALAADAVVLATPAFETARLLAGAVPDLAAELAAIPYVSTAVVTMAYPRGTVADLPPGTGFIVPAGGLPTITACTFVSSKWPREEHRRRAVVRCFVGRAGDDRALELDDDELAEAAAADVAAATGLAARPEGGRVSRWPRAMPQYEVGHLERLDRIDRAVAAAPGLVLTGSAYRGVGIADCVRQAREAAGRVRAHLSARPGGAGPDPDVQQEAMG